MLKLKLKTIKEKGEEKLVDCLIAIVIIAAVLIFSYFVAFILDKINETKETRKREKWSRTLEEKNK